MLAKVISGAVCGVEAYPVEIEVNAGRGDPSMILVGLPGRAEELPRENARNTKKQL